MDFEKADANWWLFSIEGEKRGHKIKDHPLEGTIEVNPEVDGRRLLSYHKYLRLDRLLGSQFPSSLVPDERIFIITHQLFELVFKQMLFDLGVIAETFRSLLALENEAFSNLAEIRKSGSSSVRDFWLPALAASARMKHSAGKVMPDIMTYLATEETFNNEEFEKGFRDNLVPASGFQSAQFRLIQRALGKSNLLSIKLFPADTYLENYYGKDEEEIKRIILESREAGLVSVVDNLILRESALVATPLEDSPPAGVAELDDLSHETLRRVALLNKVGREHRCELPLLASGERSLDDMASIFEERLKDATEKIKKKKNQAVEPTREECDLIEKRRAVFREDWARAVSREQRPQDDLQGGLRGGKASPGERSKRLYPKDTRESCGCRRLALGKVSPLSQESYRAAHRRRARHCRRRRPFLDFSMSLGSRFPALIAFRTAVKHG